MKYTPILLLTAAALTSGASVAAQQPAAGRHITGRVISAQASPVKEVEVCARPLVALVAFRRGQPPCVRSDADGRFSIPVEVSTTYFLTAKKESEGYPNSYRVFYRVPFLHLSEVVVADGQSPPEVTLQLGFPTARLNGSITDAETGRAVDRARVRLCRTESPKYCATFDPVGGDGLYAVAVPPSPVAMEVMAEGYEDWAEPHPLRLAPGEQSELNVALRRPGHRPFALAAPRPTAPADGAVFHHYPRTTVLEWSPVPGAACYSVEVEYFDCWPKADCPKTGPHELAGDPPQSGLEETRYEFNFIGAQRGRWRVWALDARGRAGAKSAWVNFRYTR